MSFADLNLISLDSSPNSDLPRLTEVIRIALQLGYETLCINNIVKTIAVKTGKKRNLDESIRIVEKIPQEVLNDFQHSGTVSSVKNIRQYTRFSTCLSEPAQVIRLQNDVKIQSHDIISVQPRTLELFLKACNELPVDIISLDLTESKFPFKIKRSSIGNALKRGIHFEIVYSPMIRDQTARRNIICNATKLVNICKGKNIIVSSGAQQIWDLRGPLDVSNLSLLFGLSEAQARAAVSSNCRSLLLHAAARKSSGVLMIERVSMKSSTVESSVGGGIDCLVMCDELRDDDEEEKQLPAKRIKCDDRLTT